MIVPRVSLRDSNQMKLWINITKALNTLNSVIEDFDQSPVSDINTKLTDLQGNLIILQSYAHVYSLQ